jgi:hypothetical protein
MIAMTLGFETMNKDSAAECVYCGADVAEALRVAENPGKDFARTAVFKDPEVYRRFVGPFGLVAEAPVAEAPAEVEAEAPAEVAAEAPAEVAAEAPAEAPVAEVAAEAPGAEEKPLALQGLGAAVEKKKGK